MAPRTAKSKKVAEAKPTETEAPKKGRGKAKSEPEDQQDEKVEVIERKTNRRGKKIENYNEELNGDNEEEQAPPAKKGRGKKNVDAGDGDKAVDSEKSAKESGTSAEEKDAGGDANGQSDEETGASKGRKKAAKKEAPKGKEPAAEEEKPKGRGRGRKAEPKPAEEEEKDEDEEEAVPAEAPAGRGRKKAPAKVDKEAEKAAKEAEKVAKDAEKAAKAAAKEAEKVAKDAEKAAKAAAKEAEKAAKVAAKEAEKVVKDAEKAAKAAAKDAEKAAKQAAKDAAKAAKDAEKAAEAESEDKEDVAEPTKEEGKSESEPKKGKAGKPKAKEESNDVKEDKETGSEKGDTKDEEMETEDAKPSKSKRGQKKGTDKPETEEESPDTGEPSSKRRRKGPEDKGGDSNKKINKSSTDYESIDFSNCSKNAQNKEWNFKIACWNVDGIRAWLGKGGLDYIKYEKPDILCLQEIKCSREKLPEEVTNVPGYHAYWLCSDKEGYAGVAIYTTKLAMNVQYGLQNEEFDDEGRIITAEYEQFYLICTYVPNAGRKLVTLDKRLKWNEEFRKHVKALDEKKPVIICGDMNVSHNEIDLKNPKSNRRNAGFTDEERAGMTQLLSDGYVDTFRHLYPDKADAYTFWSYMSNSRAKNVGWRLDYFIISERLLPSLCDNVIRDKVYGSDHCPISLFLHLRTADKPKE